MTNEKYSEAVTVTLGRSRPNLSKTATRVVSEILHSSFVIRHSSFRRRATGMMLLEVMLAVAIFGLAVVGLGRCVHNCLVAESFRASDARARALLANRAAEIQASLALPDVSRTTQLDAPYQGYTLTETRRAANLKNERGESLAGLFEITLRAEWTAGGATQARTTDFYLLRQGF